MPIGSSAPKPKVAVVTPYFDEAPDVLLQNHESVSRQSHRCLHVMVADGNPRTEIDGWDVDHVVLPRNHNNLGSTPRLMGCVHAIEMGVDAIAFLDADNWYAHNHVSNLLALRELTGASFLASGRLLCRPDGSVMGPCPNTDVARFVDTSCMMFFSDAFDVLWAWGRMRPYAHLIGDRVLLRHVHEAGIRVAFASAPTVNYRCKRRGLYEQTGYPAPPRVEPRPDYERSFRLWQAEGHRPLPGANACGQSREWTGPPSAAPPDARPDVFVMGCGRSGTSLVTSLFKTKEYWTGEQSYRPRSSNPRGFFEDASVNQVNESILRRHEAAIDNEAPPPTGSLALRDGQRWLARIPLDRRVVASRPDKARIAEITKNRPFCLKDPRFCYTIENWKRDDRDQRFVCVFRHPSIVVSSILEECRTAPYLKDFSISVDQSFELWRLTYSHILQRHRKTGKWHFVFYDELFENHALSRLEAFVGCELDRSAPDVSLNRSRADLAPDKDTWRIFEALMDLSR
ncbi:MAG: sulfotransferase [Myxococcota bacterium]|nr:sulfotransferase [Myxococcota bacterium]